MPATKPLLTLTIDGLQDELRALYLEGQEALSQLFEFHVTVICRDPVDFSDVIRKKATLTIAVDEGETPLRHLHGIVSRIEHERMEESATQYSLTLVPWAWLLLHRSDTRSFQQLTAPQIVQRVMEGAGATSGEDFRVSLQQPCTVREYCVQYRESDWDFVSRLLEDEGIAYYFEQHASGHRLVLIDTPSAMPPIEGASTLAFRPPLGGLGTSTYGTHVSRLQVSEEVRTGKVTLRDWNFQKPALLLESTSTSAQDANLAVYDYPGQYEVKADGDILSKKRLEALAASRTRGVGDSTCPAFAAGCTFKLREHPLDGFNQEYLLARVEHSARDPYAAEPDPDAPSTYRNTFEVIPASVTFRPPRIAPRPHIQGALTAIVVGPAGEEIYADPHGRVKVQFHWDRLGKSDEKSSCWVRVAQTWASGAFGAIFIPRVKDEVVVTFLDGDPDHPLIVGSVYHATNVTPYALPDNKTRSTIKSNTSPGGGGSNELRFEDKKGSEEVYLHAQKDWTIVVENDQNQRVGHDQTLQVGNDRTKAVKHDQTATVEHDDTLTVKHDQAMTVEHDQSLTVENDRSVTVQGDHTERVTGKQEVTIGKAQRLSVADKQEIAISKTRSLTVGDDVTETFSAKLTVSILGDVSETLGGKRTATLSGDHTASIGGKQSLEIQGDAIETVGGKKTFSVTGDVTITSGVSTVTIKPSGEITIQGAQMKVDASGPLQIHGATVDVKSDGTASLKAAVVSHSADGTHTIKGAMIVLDGPRIRLG